jgi:hypothetical protein
VVGQPVYLILVFNRPTHTHTHTHPQIPKIQKYIVKTAMTGRRHCLIIDVAALFHGGLASLLVELTRKRKEEVVHFGRWVVHDNFGRRVWLSIWSLG